MLVDVFGLSINLRGLFVRRLKSRFIIDFERLGLSDVMHLMHLCGVSTSAGRAEYLSGRENLAVLIVLAVEVALIVVLCLLLLLQLVKEHVVGLDALVAVVSSAFVPQDDLLGG